MFNNIPLIYFHGIVPGKYLAVWPVFIVGEIPNELTFKVAADDLSLLKPIADDVIADSNEDSRRGYITSLVKQRLHQRGFRERVLHAYREQCSFCKLRHLELLDAAHILPDSHPEGIPSIRNGISLCKLHHAAFDSNILGIRPDYIIEVRKDILEEVDGPMLLHGLQDFNNKKIILPQQSNLRPDPLILEKRYMEFKNAV